jgi:hypothetical protein
VKSETDKVTENFKTNLEKNFNDVLEENKKDVEKNIDLKLSQYIQVSDDKDVSIKSSILNLQEELNQMKENTEKMSGAINELKESIEAKEFILSKPDALKDLNKNNKSIKTDNNNPKINNKGQNDNLEMSEVENPNPIEGMNEDDDEKNKIFKISFAQKNIEKEIELKDSNFINIENIKLTNIGNVSCKKLYFIKEQENSSNDLCFFGNSRATNEYEISMPGELKPKQSFPCTVTMNINNPQAGQEYKIIIYAKENKKIIVSDPFEIIIKINNPKEDPMKQKQMKASQIYEEIKDQFAAQADEDLINKEDIINRLLQNNLNKDEIVNDINNKIKEKEQRENNEKAERIFGQLNMDNINLDKKEVLDYIKENQFNTEIVQKWIDDKKPKQEPASPQNPANDEIKQKIDEIYNDLEEEYGISGFLEEDAAKDKIKEFKLDKEAIVQWIENALINGN